MRYDIKKILTNTANIPAPAEQGQLDSMVKEHFPDNGYAVFWLSHKVVFGKIEQGNLLMNNEEFSTHQILQARLFNCDKEIYLYKTQGKLAARLRVDGTGTQTDTVNVRQYLWGQITAVDNGWTTQQEKGRGITLRLPLGAGATKEPIHLKTRYYITGNEVGQAGYTDVRFVDFAQKEEQ